MGGAFGIEDKFHHWETGVMDITLIIDAEDVFEGEGPSGLKHGCYFVGL